MDIIEINGENYQKIESKDGMPYVLVRTFSAGVFAGYLEKRDGKEGTLLDARRIWFWAGAATLSELAMKGTVKPDECKFPVPVNKIDLTEIIEVIYCTEKAKKSIQRVPIWSASND